MINMVLKSFMLPALSVVSDPSATGIMMLVMLCFGV